MQRKISIGIFILVTSLPLTLGLGYSLLYSLGLVGLMNNGFTLAHWQTLFTDSEALQSLGYSIYLTVASLFLILALSLAFAWWQTQSASKKWFYNLLFLPLTFPPLIAAFSWMSIISPSGIASRLSYHFGLTSSIEDFPSLVNDPLGIGILVTHVFIVFPLFTILFIHQAKKERVVELRQTSDTLGGNKRQFLMKVFVPLMLKKTAPFIMLYSIFLLGAYEVPLLLGQSSPRMVTIFITEKMSKYNLNEIPLGHAMSVLYSAFVIVLTAVFIKKSKTLAW